MGLRPDALDAFRSFEVDPARGIRSSAESGCNKFSSKDTEKIKSAEERINTYLADKLEREDMERKRARIVPQAPQSSEQDVRMETPPVAAEGGV
jgi:hypothetical protein